MGKTQKRSLNLISTLTILTVCALFSGCATIDGAGKDIEKLGDEIQDAAN